MSRCRSLLLHRLPKGFDGVKKYCVSPRFTFLPPAMSPVLRIEFFPSQWNGHMIHQFRRDHVPTGVSFNSANIQQNVIRVFAILKPGFVAPLVDLPKPIGIREAVSHMKRVSQFWDTSISNQERRLFPFRFDQGGAPTS